MTSLRATQAAFLDLVMRTQGREERGSGLAVPADRVDVYRDMVLGGYKMMTTFVFTETLRLVGHEVAQRPAGDGSGDSLAILRRFVATRPAASHSTREIADNFLAFFADAYADLIARRPELPDLMRIERAELRANYHADDPGRGALGEDIERLRALSVDEFLATRVVRAPSATFLRCAYPASVVRSEVAAKRFAPSPEPRAEAVTVSRSPVNLQPVVSAHADPGAQALERLGEGETAHLEKLAEDWIAALPAADAERDDETNFRAFGDAVLRGLGDGFLRFA